MAIPKETPGAQELHCGWTDPRDRVNWHIRSFRGAEGVWMVAFRRAGDENEYLGKNRFEKSCEQLEDHELASLLDLARKTPRP